MPNRLKVLLVLLAITVAFAGGRYSVSGEETNETKVTETQKNQETHKETTTVIVENPDGSKTTTKKEVEDKRSDSSKNTKQDTSSSSASAAQRSIINASTLVAISSGQLYYGVSLSREIAGPITAGIFGLNNGTIGLSLGVNF